VIKTFFSSFRYIRIRNYLGINWDTRQFTKNPEKSKGGSISHRSPMKK
jgi:hypothetical protein